MLQLNEYEQQLITKLPSDIVAMAYKYPNEVLNIADAWNNEPFSNGYIPSTFEIYYGIADSPHIYIKDGVLEDYNIPDDENIPSISILIDGNYAYIEIENKEILNKLGGAILPHVTVSPSTLINMFIKGKNHD